jgi:predicted O-linked N-acetylglucosamine transferase (SPINDLY family)
LGLQLHQRGRLDEAQSHYRAVLRAQPRNFDAMHLLGLLRFQQGRHPEALDHISAALRLRPSAPAALSNLGLVLGALGRLDEALASFDKALAIKPDFAEALNNRGNALLHLARFEEALASFDKALAITPGNAEAFNNRGKTLLRLKRPAEALASFDKAFSLKPGFVEALNNRGNALLDLKKPEEALASFDNALAITPDYAEALGNRGIALADLKRPEEALASFDRALAVKPDQAEVLYNRGNRLLELERSEEALASFDRALAVKPDFAEVLRNRGDALLKLNRPEEALASLDRALTIRPDYCEALCDRGNVLLRLLRPADALASFDKALEIAPDDAEVLFNRGNTLLDLGRAAEAVASLDKVLALNPNDAKAFSSRGIALVDLKRPEAGLASFERALELEPGDTDVIGGQLNAALQACRWTRATEIADQLISRRTWRDGPLTSFPLLVCCDDPSVHLDCARHFMQDNGSDPAPRWKSPPRAHGRLQIAYMSADFRVHPVGALIAEMFEHHDRTRFEVFGVSIGVDDRSEMRARLTRAFDRFLDVRYRSDKDIAQLLKEHQIDIVVDLTGYTRDGRLAALATRPAPIQVSYLGYPGTTGADFVDYVIADPTILPFDQQPYYTERIVHLPDAYQVNSRRSVSASIPTRAACGLPEDAFVFCCFNNNYKITQEVFEVWMRLLKAKTGSVLWLFRDNADAEGNLQEAARGHGVDGTRLVFAERLPHEQHLARHRQADLFLDTLPYNAHTTASDALWVGLPLVTCTGRSFASRVAASLLRAAGLPELITHSLADYESLALRLAADPALLKGYKQRLEESRDTCALFDTARFTRHIEAAYLKMWEIHERGEDPQSFSVPA